MKIPQNETRFLIPGFLILFVVLAMLAVFLLVGESRRSRILVEYEAERSAYTLADSFRSAGSLDTSSVDPGIKGFALYSSTGEALARLGDTPEVFAAYEARPGFRYDAQRRLLTLVRRVGMGGPGMRGMMGMPGGGAPGSGPVLGPQALLRGPGMLFLSMDITSYYHRRFLYRAAAVFTPFAVAGIAALFFSFLAANIRHRRRAEEQETLARLGESARTLAHEIRNPLGAIRIQTGLLRRNLTAPDSSPLDAIDEEVERLSLLTRRVSDFMKNPRGIPQRILVEQFLRDLAGKPPAPFVMTAAGDQSQSAVIIDADLLRSVVENLVRNAQESYNEGDERPVEVELSREKGHIVIAVRDRGKGIPAGLSEKVFDPFFTDKLHGSGIGLSLSRRIVEAAGGNLTLVQRHGGGTEARVTLPAGGQR
jgi:signal transduction histidine kinase